MFRADLACTRNLQAAQEVIWHNWYPLNEESGAGLLDLFRFHNSENRSFLNCSDFRTRATSCDVASLSFQLEAAYC